MEPRGPGVKYRGQARVCTGGTVLLQHEGQPERLAPPATACRLAGLAAGQGHAVNGTRARRVAPPKVPGPAKVAPTRSQVAARPRLAVAPTDPVAYLVV